MNDENIKFIAADYQSGLYASQNAAIQKRLNEITGSSLDLDGDIGSITLGVLNSFLIEKGKGDLVVDTGKGFLSTEAFKFIKQEAGTSFEFAIIPENKVINGKYGSIIYAGSYVKGTIARYNAYCSEGLLSCDITTT